MITYGYQQVIRNLPDSVWDGRPDNHLTQTVFIVVFDVIDGRKPDGNPSWVRKMNKAVQHYWWHDVNEQRGHFI